jgi:hypothetical protein
MSRKKKAAAQPLESLPERLAHCDDPLIAQFFRDLLAGDGPMAWAWPPEGVAPAEQPAPEAAADPAPEPEPPKPRKRPPRRLVPLPGPEPKREE